MRYLLPNHKEIDLDALEAAMLADDVLRRFLDTETGAVVVHDGTQAATLGNDPMYEYTPSRFFEISTIDRPARLRMMHDFVAVIVADEAPELGRELMNALEVENGTKRYTELLEADTDGWIHSWAQWEADEVFAEIESWLASLPIEVSEDLELDADCLCCRGLVSDLLTGHAVSEFQKMQRTHREAQGLIGDAVGRDEEQTDLQ